MLLLLACVPTETGIDSTTLSGSVVIHQVIIEEERDLLAAPRDTVDTAQQVGASWRWEAVEAAIRQFPQDASDEKPVDVDYYTFTALADGTFTVILHYGPDGSGAAPDTAVPDSGDSGDSGDSSDSGDSGDSADSADTGPLPDALLYDLYIYDLSQDVHVHDPDEGDTYESSLESMAGSSTQDAEGLLEVLFEVEAGTEYAVMVSPVQNLDSVARTYTLEFSGLSPEEGGIIAGAFADASDYLDKGALLGGAEVRDWELDLESRTWTGSYTMVGFKAVTTDSEAVNDFEEVFDQHTVKEGAGTVFLVAGDFKNLNQGLPAGTLHNAAPVEVALSADKDNTAGDILLDTIAPKVIGWTFEEEEPNDLGWGAEDIDPATLSAGNALPVASGLGFVDIIQGSLEYTADPGDGDWELNENDVYIITTPEDLDATIVATWADDANLDANLYDAEGVLVAAGWAVADVNPEVFQPTQFDVVLSGGSEWYLVILGWTGEVGAHDYTIELEWLSP
ncbi:MAG TPA: hypothetical protein QGF58_16135 [Myxococcota bacterium]|nr:hypothetical protein [Myxococcota bacterium]